jgi:2-oxoglutarate ferredoxin oxidoreductase subunit beta
MAKALEKEPYPLGILYKVEGRKTFEENLACYEKDWTPLYKRERDISDVAEFLENLA